MTDGLELSVDENQEPNDKEKATESETPTTKEELERIFDERFELFMNQLSERVEQEGVPVAVAVLVDPKYPSTPMVFKSGHIYDQARLIANVLRVLRQQMDEELSA